MRAPESVIADTPLSPLLFRGHSELSEGVEYVKVSLHGVTPPESSSIQCSSVDQPVHSSARVNALHASHIDDYDADTDDQDVQPREQNFR